MVEMMAFYLVFTRVLRWNIMAYLTWAWVDLNRGAVLNFKRFVLSQSPEFFWPSIQQIGMLVLPLAIVLFYGLMNKESPTEAVMDITEQPSADPG
jgi:hypothetical protein